jgi:hypothetical protein
LPHTSPQEKAFLMTDMSPQSSTQGGSNEMPTTPSKPAFMPPPTRKQYFNQYGVPMLVPVVLALVLSLALPVFTGEATNAGDVWSHLGEIVAAPVKLSEQILRNGYDYVAADSSDVQIEGGMWAAQLHHAIGPSCPSAHTETQYYNRTGLPYTALATYPRSGNTYIRSLIERATGFRTRYVVANASRPRLTRLNSSVYCDRVLQQTFLGECSDEGFLRKTHYPVTVRPFFAAGPRLKIIAESARAACERPRPLAPV